MLNHSNRLTWQKILKDIFTCMVQLSFGYICVELMMSINLHYLNIYASKVEVAAFGIAWMVVTIFILSFGIGLNQSLNTMAAQALGAGKNRLSLIYLNFTLCSQIITFIPLLVLILLLKNPLSFLVVEHKEETMDAAWKYIVPLSITSLILLLFEGLKSYLISCQVFQPFMYIHISTLLLHYFWCWILVPYFQAYGVCIAVMISEVTNIFLLLIYIRNNKNLKEKFKLFEFKILILSNYHLYEQYLKNSVQIVIHIYLNTGIFIILSFTAITLGINATNAQLALSNTSTLYFRIPLCLSIALMTYVGNEISQDHVSNAKKYVKFGITLYFIILAFIIIVFYLFHYQWASFYTSDPVIQDILLDTLPYFLFGSVIIDGLQISLSGALKGLDESKLVSNCTLYSAYFVGIPLILCLSILCKLGLKGIWIGFGISNLIISCYFINKLYSVDWEVQAKIIKNKLDTQTLEMEPTVELSDLA